MMILLLALSVYCGLCHNFDIFRVGSNQSAKSDGGNVRVARLNEKLKYHDPNQLKGVISYDIAPSFSFWRWSSSSQAKRFIHIISIGREGSSFLCTAMDKVGIPCVYEPFHLFQTGNEILYDDQARDRIKCLYTNEHCYGLMSLFSQVDLNMRWIAKDHLAFKTVHVVNLTAFSGIPDSIVKNDRAKAIVLFRDPRAIWLSTKSHQNWIISSIPYICQAVYIKLSTLPALVEILGSQNVQRVVDEVDWFPRQSDFLNGLQDFLGLSDLQHDELIASVSSIQKTKLQLPKTNAAVDLRHGPLQDWQTQLSKEEISEIENNKFCRSFMEQMQYPFVGDDVQKPVDYSQVAVPTT